LCIHHIFGLYGDIYAKAPIKAAFGELLEITDVLDRQKERALE
jgi:hypothetical protein